MNRTKTGRESRNGSGDSHKSIREHKKKRFPGSFGYVLMPLGGLIVAFALFYASRDIFFNDNTPVYEKISSGSGDVVGVPGKDTGSDPDTGSGEVPAPDEDTGKTLSEKEQAMAASPVKTDDDIPEKNSSVPADAQKVESPTAAAGVSRYQESDLWGIQLAMSTSKSDSERLAGEVRKKGYNLQITKPGEHYRVRVKGGPDQGTALEIQEMLRADGYDTLLVHSPSVTPVPDEKARDNSREFSKFQNDGTWGVQIGMFPDKAGALKVYGDVKKKGFNPEITRPGKYYRVRVKSGGDRGTAEKIESLLKKEGYDTLLVQSS